MGVLGSEESFCGDTRSGPTLPALPICCKEGMGPSGSEGIGSSVDMMTVASEASTRSLGSEQSSTSCWFEGSIPLCGIIEESLPQKTHTHILPDAPPSATAQLWAEAQLEASTRAMESLLNPEAQRALASGH